VNGLPVDLHDVADLPPLAAALEITRHGRMIAVIGTVTMTETAVTETELEAQIIGMDQADRPLGSEHD
jgi:hypothetical protein